MTVDPVWRVRWESRLRRLEQGERTVERVLTSLLEELAKNWFSDVR